MDVAKCFAHSRGITLVELLTTLVLALVVLSVAIPSWSSFTQRNAVTAARSEMRTALSMARFAAVHHGRHVTLCPTVDRSNCLQDHTRWHSSYMVFLDEDGNYQRDNGETLLRLFTPTPTGISIHSSSGRKAIRFASDGSAWGSNVTLRFCSGHSADLNKSLILYGTGRTRSSDRLADGSKVHC
jgi:type IV fimbrial biogenesis protein FimT